MSKQIIYSILLCLILLSCSNDNSKLSCKSMAQDSYLEGLEEARRDPTVWQFGGYRSAKDYANARKELMYSICKKG